MKKAYLLGGSLVLVALVLLGLCAGLFALYTELCVGSETKPMTPLPADFDVNSFRSGYEYAQGLVDEWQGGLHLTAVYAHYLEDAQGQLVMTGETTYVFAGIRRDWLGGIARVLQVHYLNATVVLNTSTELLIQYSTEHTDRRMWSDLHPEEWGLSGEQLLQLAEGYGGQEFRSTYPNAQVNLQVSGTRVGQQWLQTYYSGENRLAILINLTSGEVRLQEQEGNWITVGHISE
jgi:hypothetical protein